MYNYVQKRSNKTSKRDLKSSSFRREGWGNHYLCGRSPDADEYEPEISNNDVDYEFFEENVWPVIANRAKCFENSKVGY